MVKGKNDISTARVAAIAGSVSGVVVVTIMASVGFAVLFLRKR